MVGLGQYRRRKPPPDPHADGEPRQVAGEGRRQRENRTTITSANRPDTARGIGSLGNSRVAPIRDRPAAVQRGVERLLRPQPCRSTSLPMTSGSVGADGPVPDAAGSRITSKTTGGSTGCQGARPGGTAARDRGSTHSRRRRARRPTPRSVAQAGAAGRNGPSAPCSAGSRRRTARRASLPRSRSESPGGPGRRNPSAR